MQDQFAVIASKKQKAKVPIHDAYDDLKYQFAVIQGNCQPSA
jgi:hypothetical protein